MTTKVQPVVAAPASDRLTSVPARQALSRRWRTAVRRHRTTEVTMMLFLGLVTVLNCVAMSHS